MKRVRSVVFAAAIVLGPGARPAAARLVDGAVTSLAVVPAAGKAEVVIGVAGGIEVRDFTLRSPDRIVIDLSGASLGMSGGTYDHVARAGISDVRSHRSAAAPWRGWGISAGRAPISCT